MEITPTPAPALASDTVARAGGKASQDGAAANEMAGDFETFLTLLTTQLRNQDPLKPMDSTEFVAQLASFSAVEQQVRSNDRLDLIVEALSGSAPDGLAAWIGKEVRAPGKGGFAGAPVEVGVTPVADADRAVLVVRNDFDQVIGRREVDPGAAALTWDGTDDMGNQVPLGRYGFVLESYREDALIGSQTGHVFSKVSEVRFNEGAPVLLTEGGGEVALSEVSAIR